MYGHTLVTKRTSGIIVLLTIIQIALQNVTLSIASTILVLALLKYSRLPNPLNFASGQDKTTVKFKDNFVLNYDEMLIVGHRGAGENAPENTLVAIREAKDKGLHGVEVDMILTSDDIAVLMHDDTVDRTTDGHGYIANMSLSEVRKLNAAHYHPNKEKYLHEKVPTLEEAVQECLKLGLMLLIDVRGYSEKYVQVLKDLYKRNPQLYKLGVVGSFYPNVIYKVKQADLSIPTALTYHSHLLKRRTDGTIRNKELWKRILAPAADVIYEWMIYSFVWYLCGNSFFIVYKEMVSRDFIDYWKERNIRVLVWGVNSQHEKSYFQENLRVSYMTDTL